MLSAAAMAIDMLARPASLARRAAGQYVSGVWQPGAETETAIKAVVQPIDAETLQQLSEGERSEASKAIWSRAELRTADPDAGTEADRIVVDGDRWKVLRVWPRNDAGFHKAVAGRIDEVPVVLFTNLDFSTSSNSGYLPVIGA